MQVQYVEFPSKGVIEVKTEEISTENLAPWEVVVENEVSQVSAGTELSRLHSTWEAESGFPVRPGYGAIGRIIAKGDAVDDFNIGDRVFYAGKHASAQRFLHGQDHQWGRLYPVPEGIPAEEAVYATLGEIAMTAPAITPVDLNDVVAVFGMGQIGNLAAQQYKLLGAKVIGLDPVKQRCEQAKACGLDTVLDVAPDKQVEAVQELTGGKGAQITVDAAGHSAVVENCIQATALFGQVFLLGTPRAAYQGDLNKSFNTIHMNCLRVIGGHMWQFPAMDMRVVKKTVEWGYRNILECIGDGRINVKPLISHVVRVDRAEEIYDGLKNKPEEYWGAVFDWRN
jgi:2-desacetyl-2-hydroxyethyl bacteriochlorophyllide A dehydrogenase